MFDRQNLLAVTLQVLEMGCKYGEHTPFMREVQAMYLVSRKQVQGVQFVTFTR
jgi:hypothetical protein